MTKKIQHKLSVGGSGQGNSYYTKVMICPRWAYLDQQANLVPNPMVYNHKSGLTTGTIGHAFAELHFNGSMPLDYDLTEVEFDLSVNAESLHEAARVFDVFRERYPSREIFGKVLGTELCLPEEGEDKQKRAIGDAVGISPFTCKIDLVTQIDEPAIANLKRDFMMNGQIESLKPGVWLWDYKFLFRNSKILVDKVQTSTQYIAYPLAFQAAFSDFRCQGMIQISMIKTKTPVFILTVKPFPNQEQVNVLHNMMTICQRRLVRDRLECNPSQCVTEMYGGTICPHLVSGACRRY